MAKNWTRRATLGVAGAVLGGLFVIASGWTGRAESQRQEVTLPPPDRTGAVAVETAIANRRSRREYTDDPLELAELGQLLWATQGVTDQASGHRAAPSAGATYPLEVYVVVGTDGVVDLAVGVYHYRPGEHRLQQVSTDDAQADLREAALDQEWVGDGAVDVVITGVDERTMERYGERGRLRYVPMEAGHAGENLALQAEALGLSTVSIGAFRDEQVLDLLGAPADQRPLYVFPVGNRPRTES